MVEFCIVYVLRRSHWLYLRNIELFLGPYGLIDKKWLHIVFLLLLYVQEKYLLWFYFRPFRPRWLSVRIEDWANFNLFSIKLSLFLTHVCANSRQDETICKRRRAKIILGENSLVYSISIILHWCTCIYKWNYWHFNIIFIMQHHAPTACFNWHKPNF